MCDFELRKLYIFLHALMRCLPKRFWNSFLCVFKHYASKYKEFNSPYLTYFVFCDLRTYMYILIKIVVVIYISYIIDNIILYFILNSAPLNTLHVIYERSVPFSYYWMKDLVILNRFIFVLYKITNWSWVKF